MNTAQLSREDRRSPDLARVEALADGAFVDLACVVVALACLAMVTADSSSGLRPPLVLVFALFVPGWTILRRFEMPATLLCYIGGVGLSVGLTILLGESLVLFGDWKWFPLGVAWTAGCAAVGMATMIRRHRALGFRVRRVSSADGVVAAPVPLVSIAAVVIGNSLVALGIRHSQSQHFGVLGLVDVLSPAFWIGLTVLLAGLTIACVHRSRWAWLSVAALLTALHGLPGMLEPNPRFGVAWLHTGFVDQIATHGTLLRNLDARFSWAGFFAGGGILQRWTGTDSLLWVVRYAPLFYNGAAVILIALLARRLRATEMQAVVAAALFCCFNWIGQDYFAPQATAFLLYMVIITVVLYAFPADPTRARRWVVRLTRPAIDSNEGLHGRQATLALLGCYVLIVAVVVSHQLTPGFLLSATLLLVVVNATRLRAMPVFIAVVFLAWLSYGADAYWFGHFSSLTGSVGKVGDLVSQNVGKRAGTQVIGRKIVVLSRIGLALLAWGLASLSIVVQWARRSTPVALVCLLVAPFPMLLLQPYGGEMALRVCYFSLPPACILIAQLALPIGRVRVGRWITLGVAILALTPVFITARYGNESFEAFSDNDVILARTLYDVVPDGSTVFVATQQTIKYAQRVAELRFRQLPQGTATDVTDLLTKKYLKATPVFIFLSESQDAYGVSLARPADWMQVLIRDLQLTRQYRLVAQIGDGVLLQLEPR